MVGRIGSAAPPGNAGPPPRSAPHCRPDHPAGGTDDRRDRRQTRLLRQLQPGRPRLGDLDRLGAGGERLLRLLPGLGLPRQLRRADGPGAPPHAGDDRRPLRQLPRARGSPAPRPGRAGPGPGRRGRPRSSLQGRPDTDPGLLAHFAYADLTDCGESRGQEAACCRPGAIRPTASRRRAPISPAAAKRRVPDRPRFPVALHNLPPPNPDFVGREGPLAELRRLLTAGQGPAVLTQAITGLGGIGKTQTARAYCYRHLADYRLVWWLRAETPATLAADYATLAAPLGLDPAEPDQAKLTGAVRDALPDHAPAPPRLRQRRGPDPAARLPPAHRRPRPHHLPPHRLARHRPPAALELMPEAEALQLLTGRPDPEALPAADLAEAKALAADLGYLPLALAQARPPTSHETGEELRRLPRAAADQPPVGLLAEGRPDPDYPRASPRPGTSRSRGRGGVPRGRPAARAARLLRPDPLPRGVLAAPSPARGPTRRAGPQPRSPRSPASA